MVSRFVRAWAVALSGLLLSACLSGSNPRPSPSNILFVIMDDVGIDQMRLFGYGGETPPELPNLEAVAASGLRFRNAWAMPECSPGRAAMLVGRYLVRHQVNAALGPSDLANSQVSAYELTAPKLLKQAGYESAMFGKFHLAGPEHNPAANGTPLALGWDYFQGWIWGAPGSIDTTAGGVAPVGTYACGFVPGVAAGGANAGACHLPDGSRTDLAGPSAQGDVAGKQCLDRGGILQPHAACGGARPASLDFGKANGYYVGPLVINSVDKGLEVVPLSDPRSRGYRSTLETDAAIRWIKGRSPDKPWMATLSFSAVHTPYQQPPGRLVNDDPADNLNCSSLGPQRVLLLAGFWMDRTHVTNDQFGASVEATRYVTTAERKPDWDTIRVQLPPGTPRPPDWYRADFFRQQARRAGSGLIENPVGPADCYDPDDPGVPPQAPKRVIRGGSFLCNEDYCLSYRPSARRGNDPFSPMSHLGFRLVTR